LERSLNNFCPGFWKLVSLISFKISLSLIKALCDWLGGLLEQLIWRLGFLGDYNKNVLGWSLAIIHPEQQ
jgi:hypothetical protein